MDDHSKAMTRAEFDALSPRDKGYAVYMAGARADQPNIPESYEPAEDELKEYEAGQFEAVIEVTDAEE